MKKEARVRSVSGSEGRFDERVVGTAKTHLLRHQQLLDRELNGLRIRLRVARKDEDGGLNDLDSEGEGRGRRRGWCGLLLLVLLDVDELGDLCWIRWRESTEEELDESKHRIGGEDDLGTVDCNDGEG